MPYWPVSVVTRTHALRRVHWPSELRLKPIRSGSTRVIFMKDSEPYGAG